MPALKGRSPTSSHYAPRKTSIKDIARLARVSYSTVSRALSGSHEVSTRTADQIRRIAEDSGYRVSAAARALVMGRSQTIGVVVNSITDPFVAAVVRGIEDTAERGGYSVVLANSNAEPEREVRVVRSFEERRVDGIIVTSSRVGVLYIPEIERMAVPVVLLNSQHPSEFMHSVMIENVEASFHATQHLARLGHRRIAYIGDRFGHQSNTERFTGYRRALQQAGLKLIRELVVLGNGKSEDGSQAMVQLLALARRPTAVLCYNDMSALGAMRQIRASGLSIPEDLSVVGFDDLYFAEYLEPPLTTVRQPMRQMGRMAMETLLHIFDGQHSTHNLKVDGQLIVRRSTAAPKVKS
jgi:LacI family repressor for deo operon, udp, cdd, tsx, nupC, and nupG